ncbi:MAG: right-handed parallel beta-helix repeat-containing protein [Leptolyngbyaceae bacterium]|nr:right-handed parallel beta-helix repeat-containing protein [Leptolyngbyaceae bacterium]
MSQTSYLFSVDDLSFGDGAITRDILAGLDWLDVPLSQGRSFLDVADELANGGDFEGFRHATEAEFRTFVINAGIPDINVDVTESSSAFSAFVELTDLVGATTHSFGFPESLGFLDDADPVSSARVNGDLFLFLANGIPTYRAGTEVLRGVSFEFDTVGHWLVRNSPSFTVDTLIDEADGSVSDGDVSLRDAIALIPDGGTIMFAPHLANQVITLELGELSIAKNLTINGDMNNDGQSDITINANQQSRVFNVDDGNITPDKTVLLNGLKVTGGRTVLDNEKGGGIRNLENLIVRNSVISGNSTAGSYGRGGGIYSGVGVGPKGGEFYDPFNNLTIANSTISNNSTTGNGSDGGGIASRYGNVTVNNSTISGNTVLGRSSEGGGIHIFGAYFGEDSLLTVNNSTIIGNSAPYGRGGGIMAPISNVTAINSTISNNSAASGGGISLIFSDMTIQNSTISHNATDGFGGGIFNDYDVWMKIANSTISGNSAARDGGGIFNGVYSGLTVKNSTISGNSAEGKGGGLLNDFNAGVNIQNTTITDNTAPDNQGSGIAQEEYDLSDPPIDVVSSIIAGNTNSDVDFVGDDSLRSFVSLGNNLIGTGNAVTDFDHASDLVGIVDPGLGGLADNGGPTQTHALLPGSPAIDAGSNPDGLATDQRGNGFDRVVNGQADIGAFEFYGLFFSLTKGTRLQGINVANEDIIHFDGSQFTKVFDGSDVGLNRVIIDAFDMVSADTILMSFNTPITLPGVGRVDDSDIVQFTATRLGEETAGSFELYFDGSDVGLTRNGEDIDALTRMPTGELIISTHSSFTVPGVSGRDEDLLLFTPTNLGEETSGRWSMYVDGSDVGLAAKSENIDGVSVDGAGRILLSTAGNFSVPGLSGADEDGFIFKPTSLGSRTAGHYEPTLFFEGAPFGLDTNDIGAIAYATVQIH